MDASTTSVAPNHVVWTIGVLSRRRNRTTPYVQWKSVPIRNEPHLFRTEQAIVTDLALGSSLCCDPKRTSVVIFNHDGVPVFLSSRFSGRDAALLLYLQEQRQRGDTAADCWSRPAVVTPRKFVGALRGGAQPQDETTSTDGLLHTEDMDELSTPVHPRDMAHVQALMESGHAPFIPANRPYWLQWLLMRVTELIFSRHTVRFFACAPLRYHPSTLYCFPVARYPAVRGTVALTLDDGPCRFRDRRSSRVRDVLQLLREHRQAHATFMVIARFLTPEHDEDMVQLLREGHELGNHGVLDAAMNQCSPDEVADAVDECSGKIDALYQRAGVASTNGQRWFRAPHGKYTQTMADCITARGMRNVMCDTYASDPVIQDGVWIGDELARKATHGSILLLHMPERGFREWCAVALQRTLQGLTARGFRIVTVSELEALALGQHDKDE